MKQFKTLLEVKKAFDSEDKCVEYLARIRWNGDPICPKCGCTGHISYIDKRRVWWCGDCRKQFSIRIGTIFEASLLPLQKWFMAIWLLTSEENGISSHQLARDIGVTQKTAWTMLGRLRETMPLFGDDARDFETDRAGDVSHG